MKNLVNHWVKRRIFENVEKAFIIIADNKVTLVENKSRINLIKRKKAKLSPKKKLQIKVMTPLECIYVKWEVSNYYHARVK